VQKVIRPALDDGNVVVTDRYIDSSVAYQGYGRGLSVDMIRQVNEAATGGLVPGLTFLLDCLPEQALARTGVVKATNEASRLDAPGTRRFEQESLEFHRRVRDGYRQIAEREPDRWHIIDATQTPEEISAVIWTTIQPLLP
jgi:dTMP kinase